MINLNPPVWGIQVQALKATSGLRSKALLDVKKPIVGACYHHKHNTEHLYCLNAYQFYNATRRVLQYSPDLVDLQRPHTPSKIPLHVLVDAPASPFMYGPVMGSDPEFFLSRRRMALPAFDVLEDKMHSRDGLFWDGFQAETRLQASQNHRILTANFAKQVQKLSNLGLGIRPLTVWRVPDEMLQAASDAHVALGCDASFNIYGLQARCVPNPRELKWRFAGGHLHFELTPQERDRAIYKRMVKTLDLVLGVPAVAMAQNFDMPVRRLYYGLPGEFRLPPHGLEYRTLSNWYWLHPQSLLLVLDLARQAANLGRSGLCRALQGHSLEVTQIIQYNDARRARELCHRNRDFFNAWAEKTYGRTEPFWRALMGGIEKAIPDFGKDPSASWAEVRDYSNMPMWKDLK